MLDNIGKVIKFDQAEFIDMGCLSEDFMVNMETYTAKKCFKSLNDLAETTVK